MRSGPALLLVFFAACGADATSGADIDASVDVGVDADAASDAEAGTDATAVTEATDSATVTDATIADGADGADTNAPGPTADDWYDPSVLHEVAITLDPNDWDTLRRQTRTLVQILGPGCLESPPPDVFTWFRADATLDGYAVSDIGLKKKGFLGSLDEERPALRIETDHFVAGQDAGELEHVTLNNGRQDPSRLRQCLAYELFRAAGVAASRCSFAHVTVNGQDLGLYVNVEPVRKPFVYGAYGEHAEAQLWEGALSDFRDGWLGTFEAKLDEGPLATTPLDAVTAALARSDDELLAALDELIDLEQFITFWATESLIGHWDGYAGNTNNFHVFKAPDGRLRFIPWGVDGTFGDPAEREQGRPTSVFAVGALAQRIYATAQGRERYQAELVRVLDAVWDEVALIDRIAAWDDLTWDAREDGSGPRASDGIAELKTFVAERRDTILDELEGPAAGADWNEGLRRPMCMRELGAVSGTFTTTWGTLPIENLFTTGSCTVALDADGVPPLSYDLYGAKAGEDTEAAPGRAQILLAAHVVGAGYIVVVFTTSLPLAPSERPINGTTTDGAAYYLNEDNEFQPIGYLQEGALLLVAAGPDAGAEISGSFSGSLFNF